MRASCGRAVSNSTRRDPHGAGHGKGFATQDNYGAAKAYYGADRSFSPLMSKVMGRSSFARVKGQPLGFRGATARVSDPNR
jgi:hypothetical protein